MICRIRRHRWAVVPHMDARKCSRCGLTLTALDLIRNYRKQWWLAELLHMGESDRGILERGWPRRGYYAR